MILRHDSDRVNRDASSAIKLPYLIHNLIECSIGRLTFRKKIDRLVLADLRERLKQGPSIPKMLVKLFRLGQPQERTQGFSVPLRCRIINDRDRDQIIRFRRGEKIIENLLDLDLSRLVLVRSQSA